MKEFVINESTSGRKSVTYISKLLPNASFGFIQKMIRKKNITLNDKKMTGNEMLKPGDSIKMYFSDETYQSFSGECHFDNNEFIKAYNSIKGIKIIYEDEDYIILYKPVNVLSQKADNNTLSINEWLIGYLIAEKGLNTDFKASCKPAVCNRLDRNTEGLILAGKTVNGLNTLNSLIKDRSIEKHYIAECIGHFNNKSASINGYLNKNEKNNKSEIIDESEFNKLSKEKSSEYKPVKLKYEVLKEYTVSDIVLSKVDVDLITGKSHQIRTQMSHAGHPLLGDNKYGNTDVNRKLKVNGQRLKAYKLIFPDNANLGQLSGKTITTEDI